MTRFERLWTSSKEYFDQLIASYTDRVAWKYSILSLLLGGLLVTVFLRLTVALGLTAFLTFIQGMLPDWPELHDSLDIIALGTSFFVLVFLMPAAATVILSVTSFLQVIFVRGFILENTNAQGPRSYRTSLSLVGVTLIYFKWLIFKLVAFFLLAVLFHIPLLGTFLHVCFIAVWLTCLYFDLVSHVLTDRPTVLQGIRQNFWTLFGMAFGAVIVSYGTIWVLIYFAVLIPSMEPVFLVLMTLSVLVAKFTLARQMMGYVLTKKGDTSRDGFSPQT